MPKAILKAAPYRPGQVVPVSGVYRVIHERSHRSPHEMLLTSGVSFLPCRACRERVRFTLAAAVPRFCEDLDFGRD